MSEYKGNKLDVTDREEAKLFRSAMKPLDVLFDGKDLMLLIEQLYERCICKNIRVIRDLNPNRLSQVTSRMLRLNGNYKITFPVMRFLPVRFDARIAPRALLAMSVCRPSMTFSTRATLRIFKHSTIIFLLVEYRL